MFSGIIEEIGVVLKVIKNPGLLTLTVQAKTCLEDIKRGDSMSINGACLTICNISKNSFSCEIICETLGRTNLGMLKEGSRVNLERSILPTSRIGGHFVQGHIDGTTSITRLKPEGDSLKIWFKKPGFWEHCFISKGFICLDGMSLTLVDCISDEFSVCFIPYTQNNTIACAYAAGTIINLEIDPIAKTVSQIMSQRMPYVT